MAIYVANTNKKIHRVERPAGSVLCLTSALLLPLRLPWRAQQTLSQEGGPPATTYIYLMWFRTKVRLRFTSMFILHLYDLQADVWLTAGYFPPSCVLISLLSGDEHCFHTQLVHLKVMRVFRFFFVNKEEEMKRPIILNGPVISGVSG